MPAVTQKKHQPTRKPLNYTARQDCTKVTILYCGLGKSCNCDCTVQVYFTRTNTQTSQSAWASLKSHQILTNWPRVCLSLWRLCGGYVAYATQNELVSACTVFMAGLYSCLYLCLGQRKENIISTPRMNALSFYSINIKYNN